MDEPYIYATTIAPIMPAKEDNGTPLSVASNDGVIHVPIRSRSKSIVQTKTVSTTPEVLPEPEKGNKKWHVNAMGHVIYKDHNSYTLMKQIQMGIRTTISSVSAKRDKQISSKDMSEVLKLDFPNKGSLKTPPHQFEHFKFYDYAPFSFRYLRERFGIKADHLLVSLCHDKSLSILGTPGKSGALFFFSADMEYILKTVTKKESKFLRRILPDYYNHVMSNPSTLITRFYGLFSIKPKNNNNNVRFIIMNNVFDTRLFVEERYDLKGSTIGRAASEKEKRRETPILKDLDFLESKRKLKIGLEMKRKIMSQLESDCRFLENMKIMDYSVLLGCHRITEEDEDILRAPPQQQQQQNVSAGIAQDNTDNVEKQTLTSQEVSSINVDNALNLVQQPSPTQLPSPRQPRPSNATALDLLRIFRVGNTDIHLQKHFQGEKTSQFQRFYGGILSEEIDDKGSREIYFIGIIDLLQAWTNVKKVESVIKGFKYDRSKISAVNPKTYASRFKQFVSDMLF